MCGLCSTSTDLSASDHPPLDKNDNTRRGPRVGRAEGSAAGLLHRTFPSDGTLAFAYFELAARLKQNFPALFTCKKGAPSLMERGIPSTFPTPPFPPSPPALERLRHRLGRVSRGRT